MVDGPSRPIAAFFKVIFGQAATGKVCIALLDRSTKSFQETYFRWPQELDQVVDFCTNSGEKYEVYFCPQILKSNGRTKANIKYCTVAWADLDTCDPAKCLVRPSIEVESSPGRFQAYWLFEELAEPEVAEDISKRIAYYHKKDGADSSGWDLTQILRVPYTLNHKYTPPEKVKITHSKRNLYRQGDFVAYPEARGAEFVDMPPAEQFPDTDPEALLQSRRLKLNPVAFQLLNEEPTRTNAAGEISWSEDLWRLMLLSFEAGLSREEVFVVARGAKCNKYARDGKPEAYLWKEVGRAYQKHMENLNVVVVPDNVLGPLLTEEEKEYVKDKETFVDRYVEWASGLGDAAVQYHEAGAFIILSALLAGRVVLPTSFGNMLPNLWFMLLADTTLTRKSTSMDLSVDLLMEVDPDAVMATDGSIEGMLSALSTRPGRASIFLRDEVTGLLESMTRREYMAGMAELLTKLYDGRTLKRVLRKETIEVRDPVLVMFAGGIRNRMQQLVTLEHVSSGFLPRFVFLTATSDMERVQPLGPPTERDLGNREVLLEEMRSIIRHYHVTQDVTIHATGVTIPAPKKWLAQLTPEAWQRYGLFERKLLQLGIESERPDIMTPVYDRLAKSTLKAAVLLAAAESRDDSVIVGIDHLLQAMLRADKWREYAVDIINGVGKSADERDLERIMVMIKKSPGITRSRIMRAFHLTAPRATALFTTLEQRGLVRSNSYGKGTTYYAE
jgi:hypothetical protein